MCDAKSCTWDAQKLSQQQQQTNINRKEKKKKIKINRISPKKGAITRNQFIYCKNGIELPYLAQ